MSDDSTQKEVEQDSNQVVYLIILLILILLIIYFIYRCSSKPDQQKKQYSQCGEQELKVLLLEDKCNQNSSIQKQQNPSHKSQNFGQNDKKLEIFRQFQELQKQLKIIFTPYIHVLIQQNESLITNHVVNKITEIYKNSSQLRVVDENMKYYIRRLQDKSELKKNYGLGLQASVKLYQYCNSFREVRGDGNCFYTAFGCQFLSILLFDYSYNQFQEFIDKIRENDISMKIFVTGTDLKIDDKELEKQLLEEFLNRLTQLKQIEDINKRQEQFHTQFAAFEKQSEEIDGCLYGLSTLFFRNYSNYILDFSDNKDAVYDREKLLKWEEECNSNEVIIAELAEHLNLFIQLIFIKDKDNIIVNQYGKLVNHKIILLIKPGHYNIGYYQQENIIDQYIELIKKLNGTSCQDSEQDENQQQDNIQELLQQFTKLHDKIINLIQNQTLKEIDAFKLIKFQNRNRN